MIKTKPGLVQYTKANMSLLLSNLSVILSSLLSPEWAYNEVQNQVITSLELHMEWTIEKPVSFKTGIYFILRWVGNIN